MAQGELIATYLCQKKNYIVAKYQTSLQKLCIIFLDFKSREIKYIVTDS